MSRLFFFSTSNELFITLLLDWLDANSLLTLDRIIVNCSSRMPRSSNSDLRLVWFRCLMSTVDLQGLKDCNCDIFLVRWIIDRAVGISSMRINSYKTDMFKGIFSRSLRSIDISLIEVSDANVLDIVSGCPFLQNICLPNCDWSSITNASLASIGQFCNGLLKITVGGNHTITDIGIAAMVKGCCHLDTISIDGCQNITKNALTAIGENCKELTSFSLMNCPCVTDSGIAAVVRKCSHLSKISLRSCTWLTNSSLACIGQSCHGLTSITLYMTAISDQGIDHLVRGCPFLETIDIQYCAKLTNATMTSIADNCHQLKNLSMKINTFHNISDDGVLIVAKGCRHLENVVFSDFLRVNCKMHQAVKQFCPNLKSFFPQKLLSFPQTVTY